MKKVIQIFVVIQMLLSVLYANSEKEPLEKYWEISRAKVMFQFIQKNFKNDLFKVISIKETMTKPFLKETIKIFINNPTYLKVYKDVFYSIDNSVYSELENFYSTPIGNKYSMIMNYVDSRSRESIKKEYTKLIKNNAISKEKIKLISSIDDELNLVEIKVNFMKKFTIFQKRELYPDNNITDEMIDRAMIKYKVVSEKYESMLMPVLFYDFSEDELKEILKYASSKILAIEIEYIYKAALEFSKQAYTDLKNNIKRLSMIRFCQDYTIKSKWYPEYCKPEWLSKVEEVEN